MDRKNKIWERELTHKGTVYLETERLILRRFRREDLEPAYYNCWSDEEVWKWTNYAPMNCIADVITKANMFTDNWLNAYDNMNRYSWAVQVKDSGELIGRYFGMHPDDELRQVELACEIGQKWWNQGFMTEATRRIIEFFFKEVGMNRIFAYDASDNPASGKMQVKAGLRWEGTLRQACKCNNGIFDKVMYAILAEDYFSEE